MEGHIRSVLPYLDEKQKRLFLASCANALGWGGVKKVCEISGCSKDTVIRGKRELETSDPSDKRVRKSGGGRKRAEETHPDLLCWIEQTVADSTYGNPENPLTWTTQSLRKIQDRLLSEHQVYVSVETAARLLRKLEYSLQGNRKMLQVGEVHPDRNEQFEYINDLVRILVLAGQPVISVDTKKKENIGNFKNDGKEYRKNKDPREVLDHDFPLKELGKVAPYGVYVINDNTAYVNLGTSHDTGEFAVESISRWWATVGKNTFAGAKILNINCDCGGSNGNRSRLWKYQIQQFANRTGLEIYVSHFPPGTSKWNKIEHRLFCFISKNWAGKPLIDVETVINLISSTTTKKGLSVVCERDDTVYPLAQKVSDKEFKSINIRKIEPFGEWNYMIFQN
jgi:transposase